MVNNRGYTLIELVVVVGLTAILAISISAIMMSSLLSSSRVRTLVNVRQSGDYAISQLEQAIRNTRKITACQNNVLSYDSIADGQETTISLDVDQIASTSSTTTFHLTPDDTETTAFTIECLPTSTDPELINISFTLSNDSVSTRIFDKATVDFTTSIHPRN